MAPLPHRGNAPAPGSVPMRLAAYFIAGLCIALVLSLLVANPMTERTYAQSDVTLPAADTRVRAPDFPAGDQWLNTDAPLSLRTQLKGHVVVLDFWTYCCINCMHILPDLSYLEHKYADQPVAIIGVHSAKFENEQDPAQITQAIRRYRIRHPVVVDQNMNLWTQYGVHAWPTFIIIDSTGRIVGQASGEGQRAILDSAISQLLAEGRKNNTLATVTSQQAADKPAVNMNGLSFPGKIISDGKRLFIADSNHDRIVVTDLDGAVQRTLGSGKPGFTDGPSDQARFLNPQGMALSADGQTLYVADTDNHAVRRVDLKSGAVATLAGNGMQGYDRAGGNVGKDQPLSSPWDVAIDAPRHRLIVAMAGLHQIWTIDLNSGVARAWIGSGRENIADGLPASAALAQTSGLTILGDTLYFADSETSSIRSADLQTGKVVTLVGTGLFDFGLRDGKLDNARLQHPLGVASDDQHLYVADTYNHAMRLIDPRKQMISTLIPSHVGDKSPLNEPGGLCIANGQIYIADTNHNRIVRYDPATQQLQPLTLDFAQP